MENLRPTGKQSRKLAYRSFRNKLQNRTLMNFMKTKTKSVFTREQYDGLTSEQKQAVEAVAEYLSGQPLSEGTDLSTEKIASTFNLLKASYGCVPVEEAGEELDQTIRRKFGALFQ